MGGPREVFCCTFTEESFFMQDCHCVHEKEKCLENDAETEHYYEGGGWRRREVVCRT